MVLRNLAIPGAAPGAKPTDAARSSVRGLSPRGFAILFAVLFGLAALPVLSCGILPLVDYPNHLARMSVLAHLPHDPVLQQFYAIVWAPIPDLAMDVIVPPLLGVMPLATAGHVFVLLVFLLLVGGAAVLNRVLLGYWTAWPCLAFLLLYGRILLWGFLNDLFGFGLALLALAAMAALAERGVALRLLAGAVAALLVYFAHLMAFGIYAVALVGMAAAPPWRSRPAVLVRVAVAGLPLLLPLLLLAVGAGPHGAGFAFSPPGRKLDLLFSVFDLYHRPFDVACFAVAVLGLGYAYWRRWLVLAPRLVLPLVLLAVVYLAVPTQMLGASGIDRRLPLAMALLLVAGSEWRGTPRGAQLYLAVAAVMFLARLGTVEASWLASDREYRADLVAFATLPVGAKLAVAAPPDAAQVVATPLFHLPTLAIAERDAFVPTLFAIAGQQPIAFKPAYAALADATATDGLWRRFVAGAGNDDAVLGHYDYIVFVGQKPFSLATAEGLLPVFARPRFKLYRVRG